MTTRDLLTTTARPALAARTTGPLMLRGANVTFAPEDDDSGGDPPAGEDTGSGDGDGGEDSQPGGDGDDDLGGDGTDSGDAGDDTQVAGGGDDNLEPPKKRVPWQTKRIDQLTGKMKTVEDEAKRLREENAALKALADAGGGDGKTAPVISDDEINRRAEAIASAKVLNQSVDRLYDEQAAKDPKFAARVVQVREAVGEQLGQRPDFFQALTAIDNGGEVFNALTKDVDHLAEILEMPPVAMGIELAKLATKAGPKEPVISEAGKNKPHRPIESAAATELPLDDPNLPQAEYSRRRAAAREARRNGTI